MLFLSLATFFGSSGLVGNFGKGFSFFNYEVFGFLAPLYPLALLYPLFLFYKNKTYTTRDMQKISAGFLFFIALLFLQYLWFDKGELARSIIKNLWALIGIFGVYIFILILCLFAWILLSLQNFRIVSKKIFTLLLKFLEFTGGFVSCNIKKLVQKCFVKKRSRKEEVFHLKSEENISMQPLDDLKEMQEFSFKEVRTRAFQDIKIPNSQSHIKVIATTGDKIQAEQKEYADKVIERIKSTSKNYLGEENEIIKHQFYNATKVQDIKVKSIYSQDCKKVQVQDFQEEDLQSHQNKEIHAQENQNLHIEVDNENHLENEVVPCAKKEFSIESQGEYERNIQHHKSPRKSKIQILKEVSQNADMLSALEKGEIEKPRDYILPSLDLLAQPQVQEINIDEDEIDEKAQNLLEKLRIFKIDGDVVSICTGPLISTFEFKPANHVKVSRISNLSDDLAMALCAQSIRIQAPIPGKNVVGIEIPNSTFQTVYMREILQSEIFKQSASPLSLALGKDIAGNPFVADLKKLPHLLVAGTTGSGKSVGVNAMILSLLYRNSPDKLRLIMIDPKQVEFSLYEDIPHLLTPIITEPKKAIIALNQAVKEMDKRFSMMKEFKVKNIDSYNQKCKGMGVELMPYLVIIIDELADLMMTGGKEAEAPIIRVAQMGRASGIHFIIATQRPSADVVTGLIKTNLPSRIAFKVSNKIDSRVVIDMEGAQSLLGRGDMLFAPDPSSITRIHAPWSSEEEIEAIVESIKLQREVNYDENFNLEGRELILNEVNTGSNVDLDDLQRAKEIMLDSGKTSASFLQRRMSIGYNKAASLVEELERQGFLSTEDAKGKRSIIGR